MEDILLARRRDNVLEKSFLNIVPNSQFNFPSFGGNTLIGMQKNASGSIFIAMGFGTGGTVPPNQSRLYVYANSGTNGIIEKASDLTYLGSTNEVNFSVSGTRRLIGSNFIWNESLGKIWVMERTTGVEIAELDFNISTLTVTFVKYTTLTWPATSGSFYFSPDGLLLFTSNSNRYTKYALSTPFDIVTAVFVSTVNNAGGFAGTPVFYGDGKFAISTIYKGGNGQSGISKRSFSAGYDFMTTVAGYGYVQQFFKVGVSGYNSSATLPVFLSNDLKRMNYFGSTVSSGGRIGIGTFDIPANFRGNGNDLGGVKVGTTLITP